MTKVILKICILLYFFARVRELVPMGQLWIRRLVSVEKEGDGALCPIMLARSIGCASYMMFHHYILYIQLYVIFVYSLIYSSSMEVRYRCIR